MNRREPRTVMTPEDVASFVYGCLGRSKAGRTIVHVSYEDGKWVRWLGAMVRRGARGASWALIHGGAVGDKPDLDALVESVESVLAGKTIRAVSTVHVDESTVAAPVEDDFSVLPFYLTV